jgi:hypothetical protein
MIERFILPEGTVSSKDPVSPPGSCPFQPLHDLGMVHKGRPDDVHVIRHDGERVQSIPALCCAVQQRVDHHLCDARIGKPSWADRIAIEFLILH